MWSANLTIAGHLLVAAALGAGGLAIGLLHSAPDDLDASADSLYATRISEGEVTLEVRPRRSGGALVLQISANTHSMDLSTLDLADAVRLVVEGRDHAPTAATSLGGHHAVARVTFSSIPSPPPAFDVRIQGVPDVPQRTLSWGSGS